jgi:peptidylprolyl isomerase
MSQLRASHILIKHQGSRNPVSRRTGQSTANVTRDQAVAELTQLLQRIRAGELSFEQVAEQRSDCGSFKQQGDLGVFGPGDMMKPFEDATRALQVGQISGIVDTDSGVHLIKRLPA